MAVDPSVILAASPDPYERYNNYLMVQAKQNANLLQQRQLQNQAAVGQAYQSAADPITGQIDPTKFQAAITNDPTTAMFAPETLQANQQTQGNEYKLNSADLGQTTQRLDASRQFLAPILAKDPSTVSPGDVYSAIGEAHAAGYNTDPMTSAVAESMPHADPAQMNNPSYRQQYGQQLQAWTRGQVSAGLPAGGQLDAYTAHPGAVSTGGTTQFTDLNPITNPNAPSQSFQNTLSPDAAVSPVQGPIGPDGEHTVIPLSQFANSQGLGTANGSFGTGRYNVPPALHNPNASAAQAPGVDPAVYPEGAPDGSAVPSQQAAPGPMVTSLAPGDAEAMAIPKQNAATQSVDLVNQAQGSPQRLAQLDDLKSMVAQFPSGPASHLTGDLRGRMVQFAQMAGVNLPSNWADQSTAQDVFSKVSQQYASRVAEQLGGGVTNDKLFTSQQSSPSAMYTRGGNQMNIAQLQGNEDALQVKATAWQQAQQSGVQPGDYSNWSLNFNKQFAPSVFWYARMDPGQRSKFIAGLGSTEKQQLYQNSMQAVQQGWVQPAQLGLAASP